MEKIDIKISEKFVLDALSSTGYDSYSAMYELIDNCIDASATEIRIIYNKSKQKLEISDNGKGMSLVELREAMNFGSVRNYSENEIGYFGVGMKSSCLNLINLTKVNGVTVTDGKIKIKTNNGIEKSFVYWDISKTALNYEIGELNEKMSEGTSIIIEDVKKFQIETFKKNCGVIFYPILKNGLLKIYFNDSLISFNDPLYRDSDLTEKNFVNASVFGHSINIQCSLIETSQPKHSWDAKENSDIFDDRWTYSKGGVYFIYGGRYIEYGGTFGIKSNDPWDSRTRIELTIPKALTDVFKIKFNKTNGINLKDNIELKDVVKKIKDMFNWASNIRKKSGETFSTKDEKDEFEKITKELNKAADKNGFDKYKLDKSKVDEDEDEDEGGENGAETSVIKPRKKSSITETKVKKIFDIKIDNLGSTNCFWSLGYENDVFIITLNDSHVFYREIYRNMNESGRQDIVFLLASMAYSQYETKFHKTNINEEFFWEDYWSQVSLKLKHLISL